MLYSKNFNALLRTQMNGAALCETPCLSKSIFLFFSPLGKMPEAKGAASVLNQIIIQHRENLLRLHNKTNANIVKLATFL